MAKYILDVSRALKANLLLENHFNKDDVAILDEEDIKGIMSPLLDDIPNFSVIDGITVGNNILGKQGDVLLDVSNGKFYIYSPLNGVNWQFIFQSSETNSTGFFSKLGINTGNNIPTERLKVEGDVNITENLKLNNIDNVEEEINSKLSTSDAEDIYAPIDSPVFIGEIEAKTIKLLGTEIFGENNLIKITNNGFGTISNLSIDRYTPNGSLINNILTIRNNDIGIGTTSPAYGMDVQTTFRVTGNSILSGNTSIGNVSGAEISTLDGITGNIQTQLNSKYDATNTVFNSPLTRNQLLVPGTPPTLQNVIGITQASGSQNGFLTSSDWNNFNSKLSTTTAANTYAPINNPTFTGTVGGITKSTVGLGNVDNTSDVDKPISNLIATALSNKMDINPAIINLDGTANGSGNKTRIEMLNSGIGSTDSYFVLNKYYYNLATDWNFSENILTVKNSYFGFAGQNNPQATIDLGTSGTLRIGTSAGVGKVLTSSNSNGDVAWASAISITSVNTTSTANFATQDGNVGIGTVLPEQKLHVDGLVKIKSYRTVDLNNMTGITFGTIAMNSTIELPVFYNGSGWKRFDGTNM